MKKYIVFAFLLCLVSIIGLRLYSALFFSSQPFVLIVDDALSAEYKSSIYSFLQVIKNQNIQRQCLIRQLKEKFILLDTIKIIYNPHQVSIVASIYQPVCCINNQFVLTDNNSIVEKSSFSNDLLNDIIEVSIEDSYINSAAHNLLSLVQSLSSDVHSSFKLCCKNNNCIIFTPKADPLFTFIISYQQKNLSTLFTHYDLVKKALKKQEKDLKAQWMIDARFSDYIVAYKV